MDYPRRFLITALMAIVMLGCEARPEQEAVRLGNSTYAVPSSFITTMTAEPHQFIRIQQPKRAFAVVHDSRTTGTKDARGAPELFSLNEGSTQGVEHMRIGDRQIICRRAVSPNGGCGLFLNHGGVEWVVLIPESRVSEAEEFAADAARMLDRFKQD